MTLQRFNNGPPEAIVKLNAMVNALNELDNLRGDEKFISVSTGPSGASIRLNINAVLARVPKSQKTGVFAVTVKKDGGDAGNAKTKCSFTYTVMSLDLVVLQKNSDGDDATGMYPEFNLRGEIGKMVAPADNTLGLAFTDNDGNMVLWMTGEIPAPIFPPKPDGRGYYLTIDPDTEELSWSRVIGYTP